MKSSNIILMLCILATLTLFASCKKDKKNSTIISNTKTQYLTNGLWKMTAMRSRTNGGAWVDDILSIPPCELDNTYQFLNDFTLVNDQGASKCDISDPQSEILYWWAFKDSETSLLLYNADTSSFIIQVLDNSTLKFQSTIFAIDSIEMEWTFNH